MLKVELNRGFVKKLKVEGSTIQIAGEVGTLITSIYRNLGDSESKNGFKMMVQKLVESEDSPVWELDQALRGYSCQEWTIPNKAADRLEALLAEIEHLREVTKMVPQWVGVKEQLPAADVTPVRPELREAVELLEANYERGVSWDYICDPVAWALYQTWREINGRRC